MNIQVQSAKNLNKMEMVVLIHGAGEIDTNPLPEKAAKNFERFCSGVEKEQVSQFQVLIMTDEAVPPMLLTSATFAKGFNQTEQLKMAASQALQTAQATGAASLAFLLPPDDRAAAFAEAASEGLAIGAYKFWKYRPKARKKSVLPKVVFFVSEKSKNGVQRTVKRALVLAESVNAARELINLPGSDLGPADLAAHARKVARAAGLECEVLDEKALKRQGYPALLRVGAGSLRPPRMIILRYRPSGAPGKKHLCLLGKGLTFDMGGLNIKTGAGSDVWTMKSDMSGAAAVIHAIEAIAKRGARINVTAIAVAAENAVSAAAMLPGDIFVTRSGKSVQVENTDAEGRLILTDGLYRAGEEGATHIVDVATLTGACMRALGLSISGAMGNDRSFTRQLIETAAAAGDDLWELPLYEEYRSMLKTPAADLNNIGSSPNGGAITAGLFLSEFVPAKTAWVHVDIAGPAFMKSRWKYFEPGGTGVMVRPLARLAEVL